MRRNVRKYNHGTSLNRNKDNSRRKRNKRSDENVQSLGIVLEDNPLVSSRGNAFKRSSTVTFQSNGALRLEMACIYQVVIRHKPKRTIIYEKWISADSLTVTKFQTFSKLFHRGQSKFFHEWRGKFTQRMAYASLRSAIRFYCVKRDERATVTA